MDIKRMTKDVCAADKVDDEGFGGVGGAEEVWLWVLLLLLLRMERELGCEQGGAVEWGRGRGRGERVDTEQGRLDGINQLEEC